MIKNDSSLAYYNEYDFIQKTHKTSIYGSGSSFKKISVSLVESDASDKSLSLQMKSFLFAYIINESSLNIERHIKSLNKDERNFETLFLKFDITNSIEIFNFVKFFYFQFMTFNLRKNIQVLPNKNSTCVRLTVPLEKIIKVHDLVQYFDIDLKGISFYVEFYSDIRIVTKKELSCIFPFWMND